MKLNTKGRYAVMAMVDVALHSASKAQPITLADIATRQDISLSYLEQLFAQLRRAGLVESVRGPGGGYALSRAPQMISIAEIVAAVEESIRITRCTPSSKGCMPNSSRCLTHDLWEALGETINDFMSRITLADVIQKRLTVPAAPALALVAE